MTTDESCNAGRQGHRERWRLHVVHAILVAVENPRAVLDILMSSADRDEALRRLRSDFALDDLQGEAVLSLQWQDLTAQRRRQMVEEHAEITARLRELDG